MKKITTLIRTACLGALALVAVTCGKTGSADYRNLIPDDAFMTVSINAQSIMDKAGLSDAERAAMKGQAEMAMMFMGDMLDENDKNFILSIIDSPDNSGISFKKDMYLSVSLDGDMDDPDNVRVAFIASISDTKKFGKLIDLVKKLDPNIEFRSDRGKQIVGLEENRYSTTLAAYDDNAVLFYVNQGDYSSTIEVIADMFRGKNTLMGNKEFSKFTDGKSDIGMLLNYAPVISMMGDQIPSGLPYLDMLNSAYISMATNFEKGKIDTDVNFIFTDDKARKEFEEFYNRVEINGKFSKYLSDNAIFAMASYLEGGKTYETLLQLPQTAIIGFLPEAKTFLEAIEGEFFMSVSDFGRHGVSGAILATVTDPSILETLVAKVDGYADVQKINGNYYAIDMDGFQVEFGIKDDILFISTDSEILAALEGNSVNGPDKEIVSMFEKGNGAFYIDFQNLTEAILDNYWYGGYVDQQTAGMLSVLEMFRDMRVHIGKNPSEAKLVITMTDQDKNAMASIADKIRELAIGSMF